MSLKRRTASDEPFIVVRTYASNMRNRAVVADHTHEWHQLIYVASGLMTVGTEAGSWIAPPSWAIWVPAGIRHAIRFVGESNLRTAYLRPGWRHTVPDRCSGLAVSPLLRELVLRAVAVGMLDTRVAIEAAMAELFVAELCEAGPPPFTLPEPAGKATREAAHLIANDAPVAGSIASLARAVGLGPRTFERHFLAETGLTVGRWRQHRKLLKGLEAVAGGASIKIAASAAGYASASAYVAAFREVFGATPMKYFARRTEVSLGERP